MLLIMCTQLNKTRLLYALSQHVKFFSL